jgi:hypothetical protein
MNLQQGQVQCLAVTDRVGRNEGLHAVVEDDQRGQVCGCELVDDVPGAANGFNQRRTEHRAGTVDDQGEVVRLACFSLRRRGIGRLHADQDRKPLGDAGDDCRLERLDEDTGLVMGHRVSCSSGTIAG